MLQLPSVFEAQGWWKAMPVSLLAGVSRGPVAAVLATVFVIGGIWILTNGSGRLPDTERARSPLKVGGGVIFVGFGMYLIVIALT